MVHVFLLQFGFSIWWAFGNQFSYGNQIELRYSTLLRLLDRILIIYKYYGFIFIFYNNKQVSKGESKLFIRLNSFAAHTLHEPTKGVWDKIAQVRRLE